MIAEISVNLFIGHKKLSYSLKIKYQLTLCFVTSEKINLNQRYVC